MTKKRARKHAPEGRNPGSAHGPRPQPRDVQAAADGRMRDGAVAVEGHDEMIEDAAAVADPGFAAVPRGPRHAPLNSFEALVDYERRSLAHVAGVPEQIEAPGLWRGIGFRVGERVFVSSIHEVNEILGVPPAVTPVPATRNWLLGVANVRGNLIALVDLKQFLMEQRTHVSDRTRVLWVKQQGGGVGLLVDEVLGQRNLTDEQRVEAEGESDERLGRFVTENVTLGNTRVGMFSMVELTRAGDFQQTAI